MRLPAKKVPVGACFFIKVKKIYKYLNLYTSLIKQVIVDYEATYYIVLRFVKSIH